MTDVVEYKKYLPSYRSLLNPNARYDYKTHLLVPLLQQDINSIVARFQKRQQASRKSSLQMKYRSLFTDPSLKSLRMSQRSALPHTLAATRTFRGRCSYFWQLPVEIQNIVLTHIDDRQSYLNLSRTSRAMYHITQPFLYRSISFTSTYRFAQFITCLRLNLSLGLYVVNVDLSSIVPGYSKSKDGINAADADDDGPGVEDTLSNSLAGWRDWKYKNNPLIAPHPAPVVPIARVLPQVSLHAHSPLKRIKWAKYFKLKRSQSDATAAPPVASHKPPPVLIQSHQSTHPRISKFLLNYAQSNDVPTGYVLHLINICPNLESVNFAGLTFFTEYRIKLAYLRQYQRYDLMKNFRKDARRTIGEFGPSQYHHTSGSFGAPVFPSNCTGGDLAQCASSVFSLNSLAKPMRKNNSFLPPLGPPVNELTYTTEGDRTVYLSDLNLRKINANHLYSVLPDEIFVDLGKRSYSLRHLNMSLMIWVNLKLVRTFLLQTLAHGLQTQMVHGKERLVYNGTSYEITDETEPALSTPVGANDSTGLQELDLSNSGMYKNLGWAKKINLNTYEGQKTVYRILNNEVMTDFEEYVVRQRIRTGRPGENYFS
ncbi:hypothetical protein METBISCDRAFT_11215 [Metschnikowia bicuspidata]|uniref:F-box domain-containing protein n=1 Tax=Metschnikowia bicuspidata TaxID=27322 RepID=A0A4P9ZIH4_9ASCO|nr:hypothetical protein METBISCDRAFT_11215 [Metschnikowia bicuspidata]